MNVMKFSPLKLVALMLLMSTSVYASEGARTAIARPAPDKAANIDLSVPVNVPLFSPAFAEVPVATVAGDPITVRDLAQALAEAHEDLDGKAATEATSKSEKQYRQMLDRLVTVRLIVHEARNMGLDDLAEVKKAVDSYGEEMLREKVMDRSGERLKPDEAEVETLYRQMVREYKIQSALFEKEASARKAADEIKTGKDFDGTIKKYIDSHEAKGAEEAKYVRLGGLLPEIARTVYAMKAGDVSPVLRIEAGYVILKLQDVRVPKKEDVEARAQAREMSLKRQKSKALVELKKTLVAKYVKLNAGLLKNLNYESKKPGFEKLLADNRVLAEIKGEKPITVGELSKAIQSKFFHGVEQAIRDKTINEKKLMVLDEMISGRILLKEARTLGFDRTDEYKEDLKNFEYSALFDAFVSKAIIPDIRPKESDLKAYYERHQKDYSLPRMVRLNSMAFVSEKRAEQALARLRKGTDFKWLKANAEGLARNAQELVSPDVLVLVNTLPEPLQKALDGAKTGDFRQYSGQDGQEYIVLVSSVVPEKVQPFDDVRKKVRENVIKEQLQQSLATWTAKLKEGYPVKVYLSQREK